MLKFFCFPHNADADFHAVAQSGYRKCRELGLSGSCMSLLKDSVRHPTLLYMASVMLI